MVFFQTQFYHTFSTQLTPSAFSKTQLPLELWRVLCCKLPAVFLHTLLEEKGPQGPFYQLWQVLAKGRHLLQILLKSLLLPFWKELMTSTSHGEQLKIVVFYLILAEQSTAWMKCLMIQLLDWLTFFSQVASMYMRWSTQDIAKY